MLTMTSLRSSNSYLKKARHIAMAISLVGCVWSVAQAADPAPTSQKAVQWVTLGTNSGPLAFSGRGQPANLLRVNGQLIVVDAGDGASEALLRSGIWLDDVQTIFISHLHFDHTGGLFALLGRRFQTRETMPLTIYGPPGMKRTVDGLIAAMQPSAEAEGQGGVFAALAGGDAKPGKLIKVIELADGSKVKLGAVTVTAAVNSHYVLSDESGKGNHSFAFRFDAPGRSIVYTGDTGPSAKIEALAKNADMLVSEIMDPTESLNRLADGAKARGINSLVVVGAKLALKGHFTKQHLSPEEAGLMAKRSGVKSLLLTHNALERTSLPNARALIAKNYSGPVIFAEDMKSY